ncbi:unnamed protein product [Diatraea saccharalis]|uniref:Homeobox domain-containing protein n=1 Tax=Diatraea saccharalis TaxID=40085 RepID=A0A9N9WDB6_9NEOP|nr:unnamed protein product [Diatraea saccharalis]
MVTSLTPLSNTNEMTSGWENQPFAGTWPEDNKVIEIKRPIQKKSKRWQGRTTFTTDQILAMEYFYSKKRFINVKERQQLSYSLNLTPKNIKLWFQNRRMKEKKFKGDSYSDCMSNETSASSIINEVGNNSEVLPPPAYRTTATENSPQCVTSTVNCPKVVDDENQNQNNSKSTQPLLMLLQNFCKTIQPPFDNE